MTTHVLCIKCAYNQYRQLSVLHKLLKMLTHSKIGEKKSPKTSENTAVGSGLNTLVDTSVSLGYVYIMEAMEEEDNVFYIQKTEPISLCKCLLDGDSSEKVEISARKQLILSTVARTESYLRERRIPELIRFLLTKVITQASKKPVAYMEKLLNDCMLFRAGHGSPPVLYEDRHLEAVIKSFDPGQRGWLSAGQLRRAFVTLGLTPEDHDNERIPTELALQKLKQAQDMELLELLRAGIDESASSSESQKSSSF